jgi:DNA-binding protein
MTTSSPVVFLNRDAILGAMDVETEDVYVPEWKGTVRVRSISAAEREKLMKGSFVIEGRGKNTVRRFDAPTMRVKLVSLAVIDPEGNRVFTEFDVSALGKKNAKAVDRIADVANRLAGIDDDVTEDDETDDEELTVEGKDSETTSDID